MKTLDQLKKQYQDLLPEFSEVAELNNNILNVIDKYTNLITFALLAELVIEKKDHGHEIGMYCPDCVGWRAWNAAIDALEQKKKELIG